MPRRTSASRTAEWSEPGTARGPRAARGLRREVREFVPDE